MDKLERVARAIAQNGFGRDWDDFLPVNANDTDQGDLMKYAQAAIAALEPVTVQEAARVLLGEHERCAQIPTQDRTPKEQRLATMGRNRLRALAERGE